MRHDRTISQPVAKSIDEWAGIIVVSIFGVVGLAGLRR